MPAVVVAMSLVLRPGRGWDVGVGYVRYIHIEVDPKVVRRPCFISETFCWGWVGEVGVCCVQIEAGPKVRSYEGPVFFRLERCGVRLLFLVTCGKRLQVGAL